MAELMVLNKYLFRILYLSYYLPNNLLHLIKMLIKVHRRLFSRLIYSIDEHLCKVNCTFWYSNKFLYIEFHISVYHYLLYINRSLFCELNRLTFYT